jgi:hypothetical protein
MECSKSLSAFLKQTGILPALNARASIQSGKSQKSLQWEHRQAALEALPPATAAHKGVLAEQAKL